jgi:hypothetical protein
MAVSPPAGSQWWDCVGLISPIRMPEEDWASIVPFKGMSLVDLRTSHRLHLLTAPPPTSPPWDQAFKTHEPLGACWNDIQTKP